MVEKTYTSIQKDLLSLLKYDNATWQPASIIETARQGLLALLQYVCINLMPASIAGTDRSEFASTDEKNGINSIAC